MTTQTQVIIFCVIGVVSIPLGTFVAIKTINKIWAPPLDILRRNTGDIELVDYIQPSRPGITYYPRELLDSQFYPSYERYSSAPTYYSGVNYSSTLPSYHTVDNNIINCCLENENIINQDIIFWLITFLIINLIISTINLKNSFIFYSLIPFSSFNIDFRDAFDWKLKHSRLHPQISYLNIQNLTIDLIDLLNSLPENENFSMGLSYISSYKEWKDKNINAIYLEHPIIVNKESDPFLITQFIMETLNKERIIDRFLDDDFINFADPVILTVIAPIEIEI